MNCYQCESTDHPDCKEYFESDFGSIAIQPEECTVDASAYCVKTTGVWGGKFMKVFMPISYVTSPYEPNMYVLTTLYKSSLNIIWGLQNTAHLYFNL